eukprot:Platyproteum_vivax@DN4748_c0_g1_i2.p1
MEVTPPPSYVGERFFETDRDRDDELKALDDELLEVNNKVFDESKIKECSKIINEEKEVFLETLSVDTVFEKLRHIRDPEIPLSLEALKVVSKTYITVEKDSVTVYFKPTTPMCIMATLIGLMIRVRLKEFLPRKLRCHMTEEAINKQLNDKERVAAAVENPHILEVIQRGLLQAS